MLVLTQSSQPKDDIIIRVLGEVIVVKLIEIRTGGKVRVGVTASDAVLVNRRSVDEQMQAEQSNVLDDEPLPSSEAITPDMPIHRMTNMDVTP